MDSDKYTDPRTRSARGRGRGSGRGRARGRARPNPRSTPHTRSSSTTSRAVKRQQPSRNQLNELGSNAYRFRERDPDEEGGEDESEFDVGADFDEVAAASMMDDPSYGKEWERQMFDSRLQVDLKGLESALRDLPLWLRLGEFTRFGLGVSDHDVVENYLDEFEDQDEVGVDNSEHVKMASEFTEALAALSFDDEDESGEEHHEDCDVPVRSQEGCTFNTEAKPESQSHSSPQKGVEDSRDEQDNFDKWLSDVW